MSDLIDLARSKLPELASGALTTVLVIVAALLPIYTASHAALTRPVSAARKPRAVAKTGDKGSKEDDEDDDDEEPEVVDIRSASDAIVLPLIAACVLASLYYALKYMEDGVKKVMRLYFAFSSILAVYEFLNDSFSSTIGIVTPSIYSVGDKTAMVDTKEKVYRRSDGESTKTPFPGLLSAWRWPQSITKALWQLRSASKTKATAIFHARYVGTVQFKLTLVNTIIFFIALAIAGAQAVKIVPWYLNNLIGWAFAYFLIVTVQQTTPANALDTSLLLAAFLVYDLIMVFYTPLMIGVAKHLGDSPNILAVPSGRGKMQHLGLGDVGLPGMMMAFALQYDLYLHYLKKQTQAKNANNKDAEPVKAEYKSVTGGWGERFWTTKTSWPEWLKAKSFPKTYFHATVVGYILGLIICFIVLNVFGHAQPALIYLVPGVLGSLWGTAWVTGEIKLLWEYAVSSYSFPLSNV